MCDESKGRKLFVRYFIEKPILYFLLLVVGCSAFIIIFLSVKVPVFATVKANVSNENGKVLLTFDDVEYNPDEAIFLYESRDAVVEKIERYTPFENGIVIPKEKFPFENRTRVNADLQIGSMTLLKFIVTRGGN